MLFPRPPRPRLQRHVLSHAPESVPQKIAPAKQRRFLRIPGRVVARAPQQREQVVQGPIQRRGRPDRSRVRARVHRPRELLHREGLGGAAFSIARIDTLERVEVRILRSEPSLLRGAHRLARRPQRRRGGGARGRRGGRAGDAREVRDRGGRGGLVVASAFFSSSRDDHHHPGTCSSPGRRTSRGRRRGRGPDRGRRRRRLRRRRRRRRRAESVRLRKKRRLRLRSVRRRGPLRRLLLLLRGGSRWLRDDAPVVIAPRATPSPSLRLAGAAGRSPLDLRELLVQRAPLVQGGVGVGVGSFRRRRLGRGARGRLGVVVGPPGRRRRVPTTGGAPRSSAASSPTAAAERLLELLVQRAPLVVRRHRARRGGDGRGGEPRARATLTPRSSGRGRCPAREKKIFTADAPMVATSTMYAEASSAPESCVCD